MDISRSASEAIKIWLCFGGLILLLNWQDLARKQAMAWLGVLTLVAGLNYARFGPQILFEHIDSYDVLHYYMGAKYFEELGYYDLYPALILADSEHPEGPYSEKLSSYRAQDPDRGYLGRRPIREAIERGKMARERFEPRRWEQFKRDFYVLQREYNMTPKYWREMMDDRGFNGTPVWTLLARPFASILPATVAKSFCYLDILWLVIALSVLRWAYDDWSVVLWASYFFFVTYALRWPVPGHAFLRYDWVACLMIAMGLLRRGKNFLAGAFAATTSLLRFLPVAWMFGPAAKGLLQLVWGVPPKDATQSLSQSNRTPLRSWAARHLDRGLLLLAAGFVVTAVALEGAALMSFGTDSIQTHAQNIKEHTKAEELSSRRMGFALAYTYDGALEPKYITSAQKDRVAETTQQRTVIAVLLLLGLGLSTRKLRNDEAFALGYLPFFLLATASYYYGVARITLIVFHAQDLSKLRNKVGLGALIAVEAFCNWAETNHPGHRVFLIGHLSWALTAYTFLMVAWLLFEQFREMQSEKTSKESVAQEA